MKTQPGQGDRVTVAPAVPGSQARRALLRGPCCPDLANLLEPVATLGWQRSRIVLESLRAATSPSAPKDIAPVTEADQRAEALITPAPQALLPAVPVVARNRRGRLRPQAADFTQTVLAGRPTLTARARVHSSQRRGYGQRRAGRGRQPVLGVVLAPALAGSTSEPAAWAPSCSLGDDAGSRRAISCQPPPAQG